MFVSLFIAQKLDVSSNFRINQKNQRKMVKDWKNKRTLCLKKNALFENEIPCYSTKTSFYIFTHLNWRQFQILDREILILSKLHYWNWGKANLLYIMRVLSFKQVFFIPTSKINTFKIWKKCKILNKSFFLLKKKYSLWLLDVILDFKVTCQNPLTHQFTTGWDFFCSADRKYFLDGFILANWVLR